MPNYETIREYFLSGKWNERMLKSAVVCKAITNDQYEELVREKALQDSKTIN